MIIFIGLIPLTSCKIYENKKRDKREEFEVNWQNSEQRQRLYTFRQDTFSRLWYFWTDSAFRFHPDSGLIAQSGSLLGQESGGRINKHMEDMAEINEQGKQKETKHEWRIKKVLSAELFWSVSCVLVLLVLWRWGRPRLSG